jgi:hypothetical protein
MAEQFRLVNYELIYPDVWDKTSESSPWIGVNIACLGFEYGIHGHSQGMEEQLFFLPTYWILRYYIYFKIWYPHMLGYAGPMNCK